MYKLLIRPILFLFDPEKVHHFTFSMLKFAFKIPFIKGIVTRYYSVNKSSLETELFGLKFKNPVGLAAGFDKNAVLIDELAAFGFGFIEIGTVTPKPQIGNPKKRLFRLKKDKAIINRMGFNNDGVDAIVERLKKVKSDIIIGGNIGKNKTTPNENAVNDYVICFNKLFDYVHYFVVNVSSPNTPNLRALQDKEPLSKLLNTLQEINKAKEKPKPILLKIAPDLTNEQLLDIVDIVKDTKIDGVIAANTTIERNNLVSSKNTIENGGLSGKPVRKRATKIVEFLSNKSNNSMQIIGVGGIFTSIDAKEKLNNGAKLIQVFTGFIYQGPSMIKKILKGI
ncbi:MAG TPA: quinone-dependent dihydroorotate dehydrogenase [Flavobacteriaceae bacterium]|nr:quinone-dependent dihydroorotate dehydrogenase [Flavobacteriaceae bacterium]